MASAQQFPLVSLPPSGGKLGFQSNVHFDWRNTSYVGAMRQFMKNLILSNLSNSASGGFTQEISSLASWMENELFWNARSQDDYMNQDILLDRIRSWIEQRFCATQSDQQQISSSPKPLFMDTATSTFGMMKSDFDSYTGRISPHSDMIATTGGNLVPSDDISRAYLSGDVPEAGLQGPRKRTYSAAFQHSECSLQRACSLTERYPCGDTVDSGPTFSGSVLHYDSEASFESHRYKSGYFGKGDLNLVVSNSQSPPSVDMPSMLNNSSNLLFDQLQKLDYSGRNSLQNENGHGDQDGTDIALPPSSLGFPSQHSFLGIQPTKIDKLLSCYITYSKNNFGQKLPFLELFHSSECRDGMCFCGSYHKVLSHFEECGYAECGICGPSVRAYSSKHDPSEVSYKLARLTKLNASSPRCGSAVSGLSEDLSGHLGPRNVDGPCGSPIVASSESAETIAQVLTSPVDDPTKICKMAKRSVDDVVKVKLNGVTNPGEGSSGNEDMERAAPQELAYKDSGSLCSLMCDSVPSLCEDKNVAQNEEIRLEEIESKTSLENSPLIATLVESKSEKQKRDGISLIDYFTAEEISEHLTGLSLKVDQSAARDVMGSTAMGSLSKNVCQLCTLDRLAFPPMPIYCSSCGSRLKNFQSYYTTSDEERGQFCFCTQCYHKCRGGSIKFHGFSISKNNLELKKNDLVMEEPWVQCDQCEGWQHQICALYNGKKDLCGKVEYICPKCYLEDLRSVGGMALSRNTSLDASKLPQTLLSHHLELRLFKRLEQERENWAKTLGNNPEEVPQPADLVVRVVSSVDKRLKVKQQFLDVFPEKNYPAEFPYRSKVILLFQRIEGVDVCLFAMYVQEFGSECSLPNQRCVYISYLDSVKYFRPEMKSVKGEALRTTVYHELLVGYLDYCKKRGFATCYIWACPPVKGEDYILYCHPESQKTPRPEKLRQWYQSMLKKATEEKIVVNFTNLFEKFFVSNGECNTKITAARLPYFDGDYWSGVAENMIKKIEKESGGDPEKQIKKMTRRSLKAMGHTNPAAGEAKDILLMQELSKSIASAKDDFIIVYLQYVCTHCHEVILSGKRWFCNQCKNYQLCERCNEKEQSCGLEATHITSCGQKHALCQELVNDVPSDTEDSDAIMNNCFLENRHAFMNFCQGNHYQFDSLRRAKHSSMMILYHLHNPNVSSSGVICSLCLKDMDSSLKWTCEMCPDFIVCNVCYKTSNFTCHSHTLIRHPPLLAAVGSKTAEMVKELMAVVQHSSQCPTYPCAYPNCTLLKKLFAHSRTCGIRVSGGCPHCRRIWFAVMVHSRSCNDNHCCVPRCTDVQQARVKTESKTSHAIVPQTACRKPPL